MAIQLGKLAAYKQAERDLAQRVAEFEQMKADAELKKELEFETALDALLAKHKVNRTQLLELLTAEAGLALTKQTGKAGGAKARKSPHFTTKVYRNPDTGKEITVKLRNHGVYKAWVEQYGEETVESWIIKEYD